MFYGKNGITLIDLSYLDMSDVSAANQMYYGMSSLHTARLGDKVKFAGTTSYLPDDNKWTNGTTTYNSSSIPSNKADTYYRMYTISYLLNGGTISNQKEYYTVNDETFTLNNPTKSGGTFLGWTGSNGSTAQTSVTVAKGSTGNKTYTANWTLTTYTITYNLNGGSVSSANPTSYNAATASFTLNNPTKSGYTFVGWTGSNGSTAQTSVNIAKGSTGNKTYKANWIECNIYWAIDDSSGKLYLNQSEISDITTDKKGSFNRSEVFSSAESVPWYSYRSSIKSVEVINISADFSPYSTAYWFYELRYAETFNLKKLDVSNTRRMNYMFAYAGYNAATWNVVDLSSWNTSNVTDMNSMFYYAGYNATTWNVNLSGWNTSNVTDMSYMFYYAGYNARNFVLKETGTWDKSKVTNSSNMFYRAGYKAQISGYYYLD